MPIVEPDIEKRARLRDWVRRVEYKHAATPRNEEEFKDQLFLGPLDDGEQEDVERWRKATLSERSTAIIGLLRMVAAVGRYPKKEVLARLPSPRRRSIPLSA